MIKVNADNTLHYCREGWLRENPNEPKSKKPELKPDEQSAEDMIKAQLLQEQQEQPDQPDQPDQPAKIDIPNLDDLQAD